MMSESLFQVPHDERRSGQRQELGTSTPEPNCRRVLPLTDDLTLFQLVDS